MSSDCGNRNGFQRIQSEMVSNREESVVKTQVPFQAFNNVKRIKEKEMEFSRENLTRDRIVNLKNLKSEEEEEAKPYTLVDSVIEDDNVCCI